MKQAVIEKRHFIVDYIRKFQPVPRHVISDQFKMNRATVGNIVEALIKNGVVMELPVLQMNARPAGRPPIGLKLNPAAGCFIGVDMYDCRLTAVLTDFECHPVVEHLASFRRNASANVILKTVQQAVCALLEQSGKHKKKLGGIGLSLPGRINLKTGVTVEYYRIPHWQNIPFAESLSTTFKTPVFVEHNSSTVALAEAWNNHPQASGVVASILIRTGVSFGIVQNREIINSGTYSAGELGHTVINFQGPLCRCGRKGCLETYVSGAALARITEEKASENPGWPGAKALQNSFDADLICGLAESGDPISRDILRTMFRHLCIGLDTIMCLYAPDIITIDGIFNKAAHLLHEAIEMHCMPSLLINTKICIAHYDNKTGAVGAALLAASRVCNPLHHLLQ